MFVFLKKLFIYWLCWDFVAAWAFRCGGFSCCGARALGARASVAAAHGLSSCGSQALEHRLNSCGPRALVLHGIWDLPGSWISVPLAGRFFTTEPPGKSLAYVS